MQHAPINGPASVNNDPELTELIRHSATDLLGQTHVHPIDKPSMGGEDFANYLKHVPGSLFRLGCAPSQKNAPPLHAADFDIVHVGVDSGDKAVMICDRILRYLPVLLALSCTTATLC